MTGKRRERGPSQEEGAKYESRDCTEASGQEDREQR